MSWTWDILPVINIDINYCKESIVYWDIML